MPGAAITVDVDDREWRAAFKRLRKRMKDLSPVMDEIGASLEHTTKRRFETETAPSGEPWKPSMPSYDRGGSGVHPKGGGHTDRGQTLTDTGRLRASFTRQASEDEVIVGTNVVYAAIHQFGGKTRPHVIRPRRKKALFWPGLNHPVKKVQHPGSKVPARPFLGISSSDERRIGRIFEDWLEQAA